MIQNSINRKLIYILVGGITVGWGVLSTSIKIKTTSESFNSNIINTSISEATIMAYKIKTQIDNIEKISVDARCKSKNWDKQKPFLLSQSHKYNLTSMSFIDINGISKSTNGTTIDIKGTSTYNSFISGKKIIEKSIQDETTENVTIQATVPVYNDNNEVIGGLSGNIDYNYILEMVNNANLKNGGSAFILNSSGDLICSSDRTTNNKSNYNLKSLFKDNQEFINLLEGIKNNKHILTQLKIAGSTNIVASQSILGTDWTLFISYPKSILTRNIISIIISLVIFVLGIIVLIIITFNVLIKKFDNTLNKATEILDEERLRSRTDFLTGLSNKGFFEEFLDELLKRARISGESVAVMMIDVDNFKKYNDNYGHLKGDEVLKSVAFALKNSILQPKDFVARFGGEEFVIVLVGYTDKALYHRTSQIVKSVRSLNIPHEFSDADNFVTISAGVVTATLNRYSYQETIPNLLEKADQALYFSKKNGKNQCSNYNDTLGY